ncbi:MAG TPA: low-complexity protein [Gammaproteobacteria bacterium]|nr:low-complexity protein [Gammaproteobacteria bacterium]
MSKDTNKTIIALAASAALTTGLSLSSVANADTNPFAAAELSSGYMQLAGHHGAEGKCGEGKCGNHDEKAKEGKCGEGKCGNHDEKAKEGKCGNHDEKAKEG